MHKQRNHTVCGTALSIVFDIFFFLYRAPAANTPNVPQLVCLLNLPYAFESSHLHRRERPLAVEGGEMTGNICRQWRLPRH
jgi:hypothetical protein